MTKRFLMILFAAFLLPLCSYGQGNAPRKTAELMKDETAGGPGEVLFGRITTTSTLREMILRDPRLIPQSVNCEVLGFTFSIASGDKNWGPVSVKGPRLNQEMKDRISDWDGNITVSIRDIQVKCNGRESTANPITLKFDH